MEGMPGMEMPTPTEGKAMESMPGMSMPGEGGAKMESTGGMEMPAETKKPDGMEAMPGMPEMRL